jgi:hypothetical protein
MARSNPLLTVGLLVGAYLVLRPKPATAATYANETAKLLRQAGNGTGWPDVPPGATAVDPQPGRTYGPNMDDFIPRDAAGRPLERSGDASVYDAETMKLLRQQGIVAPGDNIVDPGVYF